MRMKKQEIAKTILKMAERSASQRVDSASPWYHYQMVETQKIKDAVKENKDLA